MTEEHQDTVKAFGSEHRIVLALLAHAAKESVDTRAGEFILENLYSSMPSLKGMYPEVALLYNIHQIRRALRNQQGSSSSELEERPSDTLCGALREMHSILPDPLLLVIAEAEEMMQTRNPPSNALDFYIMEVVEYIQSVLLKETKSLQQRGASITLRLQGVPPFVQ